MFGCITSDFSFFLAVFLELSALAKLDFIIGSRNKVKQKVSLSAVLYFRNCGFLHFAALLPDYECLRSRKLNFVRH